MILAPLVILILRHYWSGYERKTMIEGLSCKEPEKVEFMLCQMINRTQWGQREKVVFDSVMISFHSQRCMNVKCYCHVKEALTNENTEVNFFNESIRRNVRKVLLIRFSEVIQNHRHDSGDKFTFILHYISALNSLGWNTHAFQQTNLLLFQTAKTPLTKKADTSFNDDKTLTRAKSVMAELISHSKKKTAKFDMLVRKKHSFTLFQKLKLQLLQSEIKATLNLTFATNQSKKVRKQEELNQTIQQFLASEYKNRRVCDQLMRLLKDKLHFL